MCPDCDPLQCMWVLLYIWTLRMANTQIVIYFCPLILGVTLLTIFFSDYWFGKIPTSKPLIPSLRPEHKLTSMILLMFTGLLSAQCLCLYDFIYLNLIFSPTALLISMENSRLEDGKFVKSFKKSFTLYIKDLRKRLNLSCTNRYYWCPRFPDKIFILR